jgi:anionic cell wall polymer biosynthesis LytR-Cps2A-Psr (LCP) family protein
VVDVDGDVTRTDKDGVTEVLLKAGPKQTLDGESAARYATFAGPDEQELARLPRLQAVLDGILARLPDTPEATTRLLPGGAGSLSSVAPATLATLLHELAAASATNAVSYTVLPVTEVDTGGEDVTYRIERAEVDALVQKDLAGSVPQSPFGSKNRVLVRNGVGTAGIGQSVTRKLTPAGFRVVGTGNAPTFDYKETVVLVFNSSDEDAELGRRVAEVLGVGEDAVRLSDLDQTVADVIVIVGADFKP